MCQWKITITWIIQLSYHHLPVMPQKRQDKTLQVTQNLPTNEDASRVSDLLQNFFWRQIVATLLDTQRYISALTFFMSQDTLWTTSQATSSAALTITTRPVTAAHHLYNDNITRIGLLSTNLKTVFSRKSISYLDAYKFHRY